MKILLFLLTFWITESKEVSEFHQLLQNVESRINKSVSLGSTKTFKKVEQSPTNTIVYNANDLLHFRNLAAVINQTLGFNYTEASFGGQYFNVRGVRHFFYNNKIIVTINGIRLVDPLTGGTRLDILPLSSIKRIEIIKGAGSPLYGSNAYAAVIAIQTWRSNDYKLSSLEMTFDSEDSKKTTLNYFSDNMFVSVEGAEVNMFKKTYKGETFNSVEFMNKYDDYHNIIGNYRTGHFEFLFGSSRINRVIEYNKLDNNPRTGIFGPMPAGMQDELSSYTYDFVAQTYKKKFSPKRDLKVFAKLLKYSRYLNTGTLPYFDYDMESKSFSYEIQYHQKLNKDHEFVAGYEREFYDFFHKTDTTEINKLLIPPSLRNPAWPASIQYLYQITNNGVPFANPYHMVDPNKENRKSFFGQWEWDLNSKITFINSYRKDQSLDFSDSNVRNSSIVYKVGHGAFLKYTNSTAYRFPHMGERFVVLPWAFVVPHEDIRSEKVDNEEWSFDCKRGKYWFRFSTYSMMMYDMIYMAKAPQGTPYIYPNNVSSYVSEGVEFSFNYNLNDNLGLGIGGSWNDTDALVTQYEFPDEIKRMFYYSLDYKKNSFNIKYYGKTTGPRTGSAITMADGYTYPSGYYGSYTIHNLSYIKEINKNTHFQILVENIFNKRYTYGAYLVADNHEFPLPDGRRIQLGFKVRF